MNIVIRNIVMASVMLLVMTWAAKAQAVLPPIGFEAYIPGADITDPLRKDPNKALAYDGDFDDKPLADNSYNFVTLGLGGSIILTVLDGYSISNGEGKDFKLFETTYGGDADNWNSYKETAHVFAYNGQYTTGGDNWYDLGFAYQDGEFDLKDLLFTTAIKIVDVTNKADFKGTADGYDLDGMSIHNVGNPVPIPGAALLLGSALLGVVGLRRARTV